ncbi:pyridoxal phosphate-dependent aminotransferase [Enterococcus faecalis]|nr:pyridoxal phosphate-dependent aminotransferase [Enterococcus faecalis]
MFNFNETIDRRHTNCVKWDTVETSYHEKDLLPLWVADMDFKVHQPILDALSQVIEQGILGYAVAPNELYQAIQDWQRQHHQLIVEKEEILFNSGVVPSLATAVQAYTAPADSVMICDPVSPPFADVVKQNERRLVRHSLLEVNGHYEVDLVKMEQQIIEEKVKLLLFCNPHNPGGRVWTKEELLAIGRLCQKHQVTVVSDEIHQDLIFKPHTFTSFTVADDAFKEFTVTLTAATKTFNLAGIKNSMLFIPNEKLRQSFVSLQDKNHQGGINTFGYVGTAAAYQTGEEWLTALLDYLKENIDFALSFFREELPSVRVMEPEGTYLLWLDFSSYSLTDRELRDTLIHKGKVVLNPGISFGPQGSQHMRLNLACSKETLEEGLLRIKKAFN